MKKIVINGFGRIGRIAYRLLMYSDDYEVVAINSHSSAADAAYLLKYDTVHRTLNDNIIVDGENIIVGNTVTKVLQIDDVNTYPWGELGVDLVLDCTGKFTKLDDAMVHINRGAKHVIISAPAKDEIKTIVYGVNDDALLASDLVISAASCTTNALAPLLKVINDNIGITSGFMSTIHAYTNDQNTHDGTHKKGIASRRGRSAAENIIPASTGAATAIGKVIPELDGKLAGAAFRVPVNDGSVIDLTLTLNRETTKEELNNLLSNNLTDIIELTNDPIVSSDIIGNSHATIVDGALTKVLDNDKRQVKIVSWYDNEYGYTSQMIKTMDKLLKL